MTDDIDMNELLERVERFKAEMRDQDIHLGIDGWCPACDSAWPCISGQTQQHIEKDTARISTRLTLLGWRQRFEGEDGAGCWDGRFDRRAMRLIHSIAHVDGQIWAHLSFSRQDKLYPTWEQARDLWRICYPETYGIIVIAPEENHVNIAEVAHVWGRLDAPTVPDFTMGTGSI